MRPKRELRGACRLPHFLLTVCREPSAVSESCEQAHVWHVLRREFKEQEFRSCNEPTAVSESCEQARVWRVPPRYFKEQEFRTCDEPTAVRESFNPHLR